MALSRTVPPAAENPCPDRISADPSLWPDEIAALDGGALLENFALYSRHASRDTELFWAKAWAGDQFLGAAPVVRLQRRKVTDLLRRPLRRWLGPILGPLAKKTSLLVDTSFLAYDDRSPFLSVPGVDRTAMKRAVAAYLKGQKRVDSIWISEPPAEAAWSAAEGFRQFLTLPMVHVDVEGCSELDDYAASLSKKRRRNFRHERDAFAAHGASIETYEGPLGNGQKLLQSMLDCLAASAEHSAFTVPYNDVLTDAHAFAEQRQTALVARVDGQVVGFMSFLEHDRRLMQCHGGLDYTRSHEVFAYHNLIYAAIELAIKRGCRLLSMGPLNNETKRRAGSALRPIVASLWNRNPVDRLVANKVFVKNFEVYQGELDSLEPPPH